MSYGRQAVVPAPAMDSPRRLVPAESLASLSASSRFKRAPSWDISQPSGLRAGPCGNCDRWPLPNPITMNNAPSPRLDGSPRLGVGRKGVFSTPPSWSIDKGSQTRRLRETEVPTWSPHLNQPQHRTLGTPFALYGASSSPRQNRHHASVASLQPTRPAGFGFQPVPLRYALTPSQPKPKRIVVPPKTQHWLVDQRGNELDEYDPFVALPIVDGLLAADEEVFQANVDMVFIESNVDEDGWLGRTEVHAAVNLLCSRIGMRRLPEERIDEIIRSCNKWKEDRSVREEEDNATPAPWTRSDFAFLAKFILRAAQPHLEEACGVRIVTRTEGLEKYSDVTAREMMMPMESGFRHHRMVAND